MKVHDAIVDALLGEGVDTVFGLLGGGIGHLVDAAVKRGIRFVTVRHEQAAVGAADGYSRVCGRIGVAVLSYGPGLANAATPMVVARKAHSKVLVITSAIGDSERFTMHLFDQEPYLRSTIGTFVTPRWPASIQHDLTEVFSLLARDSGPVALNLNHHLLGQEVPEDWKYVPIRDEWGSQRVQPDPQRVTAVVDLIAEARRPLILAGRGAVLSGALPDLIELADQTGAALSTTLLAKNWFDGHPANLGITGGFGDKHAQLVMRDSDLVLAFGARISRYTAHWGTMFEKARIVRVDSRPDSAPDMTPVDISIWADAKATARALLAELSLPKARTPWTVDHVVTGDGRGEETTWARDYGLVREAAATQAGSGVDVRRAIDLLGRRLPTARGVVIDAGNHLGVPAAHFSVADPLDLICAWEFGAIGGGLGLAIGAATARPERPTVAFLGDGCLMLGLSDLDTVSRYRLPMLIVVQDDGGFRSERNSYNAIGLEPTLADYVNPDLAAVARSLGLNAYSAANDAELDGCLEKIFATDPDFRTPTLLCIAVDRFAPNEEIDSAFASYRPY